LPADHNLKTKNQLSLLREKRFGPFFLTQFFGAFNDNVFKNALIILIAYQSIYSGSGESNNIINFAAILFILPFFLFSATAGQIADRFEKASLIKKIKIGEICIMLFAAIGFYLNSIPLLLLALFFMGSQSSFFGPIKYSIIPEHLRNDELIGGNALVESGTFMAILLGTIFGGILAGISSETGAIVSCAVISLAVLGYLSSLGIPRTTTVNSLLKIRWNPISETYRNVISLRENKVVFSSILGVSWFWFLGATYITQLPNFTHLALGADVEVVTLFLTLFCIGIGTGSLLCERLSNRTIELGLVPMGAIGLTLFGIDAYFATTVHTSKELLSLFEFIQIKSNWRLCIDLLLIGTFGGIYIVPLYALIQARTNPNRRSRVIAGNNILNAIAIVAASVYAISLLNIGLDIPQLFLTVALLNAIFAFFLFLKAPEFPIRFIAWVLTRLVYRVEKIGLENIPEQGSLIVIFKHASIIGPLILSNCIRRPIRVVVQAKAFTSQASLFLLKGANAIFIHLEGKLESMEESNQLIISEIVNGNAIGIFQENENFKKYQHCFADPSFEEVLAKNQVAVIPITITRLHAGNQGQRSIQGLLRSLRPELKIVAEEPVGPDDFKQILWLK